MGLEKLRTRGSVLVPKRVIQRLFFYRGGKVLLCLGEVSLQEFKSAEGEQDLRISWILGMRSHECIFYLDVVEVA